MLIKVKTFPDAKKDRLEKTASDEFSVWVKSKAQENQANAAVIYVLAQHFHLPKNRIRLRRGFHRRHKIFEIIKK